MRRLAIWGNLGIVDTSDDVRLDWPDHEKGTKSDEGLAERVEVARYEDTDCRRTLVIGTSQQDEWRPRLVCWRWQLHPIRLDSGIAKSTHGG